MIGEYCCRPREQLPCFYITKENIEEFVDKYGINQEHIITYSEYYAHVKYKSSCWNIRLNAFMIREDEGWCSYTKEEFDKLFEITL